MSILFWSRWIESYLSLNDRVYLLCRLFLLFNLFYTVYIVGKREKERERQKSGSEHGIWKKMQSMTPIPTEQPTRARYPRQEPVFPTFRRIGFVSLDPNPFSTQRMILRPNYPFLMSTDDVSNLYLPTYYMSLKKNMSTYLGLKKNCKLPNTELIIKIRVKYYITYRKIFSRELQMCQIQLKIIQKKSIIKIRQYTNGLVQTFFLP